jgi:hypothetical protein
MQTEMSAFRLRLVEAQREYSTSNRTNKAMRDVYEQAFEDFMVWLASRVIVGRPMLAAGGGTAFGTRP